MGVRRELALNRRGFLGALGAAIAGATLDPERALWVPGRKLISVPAATPFGLRVQYFYVVGGKSFFEISEFHDPTTWIDAEQWVRITG